MRGLVFFFCLQISDCEVDYIIDAVCEDGISDCEEDCISGCEDKVAVEMGWTASTTSACCSSLDDMGGVGDLGGFPFFPFGTMSQDNSEE